MNIDKDLMHEVTIQGVTYYGVVKSVSISGPDDEGKDTITLVIESGHASYTDEGPVYSDEVH